MTHDNVTGIVMGLVLLVSVLAMIGSMNVLARTLHLPGAATEVEAAPLKFMLTERR